MSISQNLRRLRLDSGMTQEQAAAKLNIARQTLSSYESGRTRPDVEMLLRLSQVYGTDLDTVLYGSGRTLRARKWLNRAAVVLLILLVGLTLAGSALRWSAHYFFPVSEGQLTQAEQEIWAARVRLTEAGEQMEGIALLVSSWGFAALVLLKQLGNCTVSRKSWLSYAAVFTAGLLLASLPFAAADPQFTAVDYGFVPADAVCCLLLWSAVDWGIGWIRKRVRSGSQANI